MNDRIAQFRTQLKALASRFQPDLEAADELAHGAVGGHGANELSNAPMHLGDQGTDEFLHDVNATLLENEQYLVDEVQEALRRIESGTFGVCEECATPIPDERLDAVPYARHCVNCAERDDASPTLNVNRGRPQSAADTLSGDLDSVPHRRHLNLSSEETREDSRSSLADIHAAGMAGGGTVVGGIAGTNIGHGDPDAGYLQGAMGSGKFDSDDARDANDKSPRSGKGGGSVGGTPAGKRSR